MSETELIKIARLEERMDSMEKTQDAILKRLDERDIRSNSQLYMLVLNLLGIIVTLSVVLIRG